MASKILFKKAGLLRSLSIHNPRMNIKNSKRWKSIRIGCSSGFFGDTSVSARQLVEKGRVDYLVMDYLSEITMSLLVGAQKKNPSLGFIPDFVQQAKVLEAATAKGIKVIANAGGINPHGCAAALRQVLGEKAKNLKLAVITGDDLMPQLDQLLNNSVKGVIAEKALPATTNSMTAYLGAQPIAKALAHGADIVITGRCTDSALALGPLMYYHGWTKDDLDQLASGSLAGHLIECGAQATGGIYTDWDQVEGWENIGFPVVECNADGSFILTKPEGTGGLVSVATASEQLVYEIHDPSQYILPDVTCDFTNVTIQSTGKENEVLVKGAKGWPAPDCYKVCSTYSDGFRITAVAPIGGPRSAAKGRKVADAILKRVSRMHKEFGMEGFSGVNIQVLGSEQTYGSNANPAMEQTNREGVLWLAATHNDKKGLELLSREIAPAGTGMAPGLTGIIGGRPKVSPVFKLHTFLYPKKDLKVDITLNGKLVDTYTAESSTPDQRCSTSESMDNVCEPNVDFHGSSHYRLEELAFTRSGDKGNHCNIGVVCRKPDLYPILKHHLTVEKVGKYFRHVFEGEKSTVERYEMPGIYALNFVLRDSLGGGGITSLRSDPQGKAFGQMLLDLQLDNLPNALV